MTRRECEWQGGVGWVGGDGGGGEEHLEGGTSERVGRRRQVVVDETALEAGRLQEAGVKNLQAVQELIAQQVPLPRRRRAAAVPLIVTAGHG